CGYVTASAKPVAIAASTAFPPWRRTSAPIRLAISLAEATIPRGARTTADTVASGGESGAGRTEGGAPGPAAGRAQAAASAATATTTAVARRNETVRLRSVNTCVIPTSARVGDLGDRGIYHGASGPNNGAPPLLPSLHAPSPPPRGCIRHRTCFKPERAFVADLGPARAGGSPLERPPPVALAGDDAVSEASALAVQGPSQPFPVLGRQDFEPEPPDPERDQLEPDQPPGPGFQPREVHEHEIAPELVVPGDPLVVVQEIAAPVEDRAVPEDLDRLRVVRRVAVDDVDPGVFDQRVGEATVLLGDLVPPVPAPVDRGDGDVARPLRRRD